MPVLQRALLYCGADARQCCCTCTAVLHRGAAAPRCCCTAVLLHRSAARHRSADVPQCCSLACHRRTSHTPIKISMRRTRPRRSERHSPTSSCSQRVQMPTDGQGARLRPWAGQTLLHEASLELMRLKQPRVRASETSTRLMSCLNLQPAVRLHAPFAGHFGRCWGMSPQRHCIGEPGATLPWSLGHGLDEFRQTQLCKFMRS